MSLTIGIVVGRIGGIDGVALETEKWIEVLRRMGHRPIVLTGELEAKLPDVRIVPELAFSHPGCAGDQEDAFFRQDMEEGPLLDRLEKGAALLERRISDWLREERVDVLLTENSTTLPCHLTMGMALRRVIEQTGIPAIAHDHDFHWERGDRYRSRYEGVQEIIEQCFPPDLPNLRHVVINSYCRESLMRRYGMESVLIPNVMDFEAPFGVLDEANRDLPGSLGFESDDLLLFQVTRIVRRKGIETAIDLVHRLDDPRVKLVVTGTSTDDWKEEYTNELRARVRKLDLERRVLFAGDRFCHVRPANGSGNGHGAASAGAAASPDGSRMTGARTNGGNGRGAKFSLEDGYANAVACTYFSRYEGFGNAFVEAVAARRPIFVNNYEPVFWPDIGSKGFRTVQIEDNALTVKAVADVQRILASEELRRDIAEHNFELGREHFSYEVLEVMLRDLIGS